MKKAFLILVVITIVVGCDKRDHKSTTTKADLLAEMNDSVCSESLIFWTSDTACSVNPELLTLLDVLYQHVRSDAFPANAKNEEKWMSDYRQKLCAYYDKHKMGSESIPVFAKADTVLNEGVRLIELDDDWSTMGTVFKNDTEHAFDMLREYGLLTQIIEQCESEELKDMIYEEWELYEKLSNHMKEISSGITRLQYWGGSIVGPIATSRVLQISDSRREMLQTILNIIEGRSRSSRGIFLDISQQLLLDCSIKAVKDVVSETKAIHGDSPYMGEDKGKAFEEQARATEVSIEELCPLLREWGILWENIDVEMTQRWSRYEMERAASYMLIRWASIASAR